MTQETLKLAVSLNAKLEEAKDELAQMKEFNPKRFDVVFWHRNKGKGIPLNINLLGEFTPKVWDMYIKELTEYIELLEDQLANL